MLFASEMPLFSKLYLLENLSVEVAFLSSNLALDEHFSLALCKDAKKHSEVWECVHSQLPP